jgi:iron-sulfur cluster insertion protein
LEWAAPTASTKTGYIAAAGDTPYLTFVNDISLTESAAKRVAWIAERQSRPAVLRLAVDGGGCAGFTYKFELADAPEGDDTVAETDGVKLVVDPVSLELVKGSAVDFVEDLNGAAFKVLNPNAQSGCGCGSSFSV